MSGLSIGTGTAVLGTHTMEVTVYHRRGSESYMPLAHSRSAFAITGKDFGQGKANPRTREEGGEAWLDWKGKCNFIKGQNRENLGRRIWGLEPVKG